jgi:CubicO group peptidase (beta-lactamase class C family)
MAESSLPLTTKNLPAGAPRGYSATGIAEAPWTIDGWAPAGGVRSTAADMARYAQTLLDGSAPGMDALTPRWQFGEQQIGYVWTTQDYQGHTITFKNGLTGGFTSKIILDRANHRAVIVLSNTAAQLDSAANSLLVGEHAWISSQ